MRRIERNSDFLCIREEKDSNERFSISLIWPTKYPERMKSLKIRLRAPQKATYSVHLATLLASFLNILVRRKHGHEVWINLPSSLFYCWEILGVLQEVNRQMIENINLRSRRDLLFAFCPVELAYSRGWYKPLPSHQSNNKMNRPIIWSCKVMITYNCAIWLFRKALWITLFCLFGLILLGQNQWAVKKSSQSNNA